eukprot:TRINITY_DN3374_c1_g1_i5.p2 TRINITY_DN3374_c1_g1~~TRINITY_DN3374_c1_g1_i5.p2  ORF type:complete len:126 (+),score=16.67 TRINITY_DN3374_c1_g1_i5:71-448(+)
MIRYTNIIIRRKHSKGYQTSMYHKTQFPLSRAFSQQLFFSSQGQLQEDRREEQGGTHVPIKKRIRKLLRRGEDEGEWRIRRRMMKRPKAPHNTTQYIIKNNSSTATPFDSSIISLNSMIGKIFSL